MGDCQMIYLTGAGGLVGRRFRKFCDKNITTISYRDTVYDVFKSHKKSCLVHLGWSSTTRDKDREKVNKDIENSRKLFDYYIDKNPNGKIIFISSAGDMHQNHGGMFCSGLENPTPRTLYGKSKLHVEKVLQLLPCKTVVLRTSNIWGGEVDADRVNGLPDKLFNALNTDKVVEIYANLDTCVDLIHVDDFVSLLIKVIDNDLDRNHELFLVGGQSITIGDIINRISKKGSLNLKINQKADKSFINVQPFKAQSTFDWKREYNL
jgi:nucleoside-diphosphate-sugar epimerase